MACEKRDCQNDRSRWNSGSAAGGDKTPHSETRVAIKWRSTVTETTINPIPMIERRRIEAAILKHVYDTGFNYQADPVSLALVHAKYGKLPKDWSTDDPSASSATRSRAGR